MESPLGKFIEWYESLPITQRQDIGAIIGMSCPGFGDLGLSTELEDIPKKFVFSLKECLENRQKEIGMVLLVRSAVEFFFIGKRSDPNSWKESEAILRKLAKEKGSETFEKSANEKQFQSQQWKATCEKWNQLFDDSLNDKCLDFYHSQLN